MLEWGKFCNLSAVLLSSEYFVNQGRIGCLNVYPAEGQPNVQVRLQETPADGPKITIRKKKKYRKLH